MNMISLKFLVLLFLLLVGASISVKSNDAAAATATSTTKQALLQEGRIMNKPDRFVQAAPLILAVSCKDGVVILAAHTSDEDEPLLYYDHHHPSPFQPTADDVEKEEATPFFFRNLPPLYAGPFRIQSLDHRHGITLVCTGWRADCEALMRKARSLALAEMNRFGGLQPLPMPSSSRISQEDNHADDEYCGSVAVLAAELSLHLARCVVSDNTRARSCAGLLVSPFPKPASVWLVDATGAYPVRSLCIGGGGSVSDLINQKLIELCGNHNNSWSQMDCDEALKRMLHILANRNEFDEAEQPQPYLPKGTRLEVCFVRWRTRQMMRRSLIAKDELAVRTTET